MSMGTLQDREFLKFTELDSKPAADVNVVRNRDFLFQVTAGSFSGYRQKMVVGHNANSSTTQATMWEENIIYTFPTTATQMTISSTSANDSAAGTGARTVLISGLDSSYNEISETVTLNGTTPVTTVNSYLRVSNGSLRVMTAGSVGSNVGILYLGTGIVTAGKPAVVYAVIILSHNVSHSGTYTVPAGKTAILNKMFMTIESSKYCELYIYYRPFGGVWYQETSFDITAESAPDPGFGIKFPEKTDIRFDVAMAVGTGKTKITCSFVEYS